MKKIIHRSNERGYADHGWLKARHSFSFASWYEPAKMNFGTLRVLNDDIIAPGMGFGSHPHNNMEIVTIPLSGAIAHKDNAGNQEVICSGDVQIMSAGSGIVHSEFNASKSEILNLFQIWVFPKLANITPRYEQKTFEVNDRKNHWQIVVSPNREEGGVWINQDAWFSLIQLNAGLSADYQIHKEGNGVYFMIIEGSAEIALEKLNRRDAIGLSDMAETTIKAEEDLHLLAIEVPMNELINQ